MTPLSPYLLITVKATKLEKVSLSDKQNLKTVSNTLTTGHKYSLLNRDNLTQLIHIESSLIRKTFSQFFSWIFKISIKVCTFS